VLFRLSPENEKAKRHLKDTIRHQETKMDATVIHESEEFLLLLANRGWKYRQIDENANSCCPTTGPSTTTVKQDLINVLSDEN
jgi:hypothetical protein